MPRFIHRCASPALTTALAVLGTALLAFAGVEAGAKLADNQAASAQPPSCFLGGIAHTPSAQAETIERATIFIALVQADGTLLSQGTGFVAAGSASQKMGPRIVTAAHVVEHDHATQADERIMAFFSDGAPIGTLSIVAAGPAHAFSANGFDIVADDVAVVEIEHFAGAQAQRRYARLAGLPILRGDAIQLGEASDPVGAFWGFSGAAAVDSAGRVVGVLTGASFRGRVTKELGSVQETNAAGVPVSRAVTLPTHSLIVVEPLRAVAILQALGPITTLAMPEATPTVLAGFPMASCASTSATLEPLKSDAGRALLSRWEKIGLVGAWFLPPPLGQTKLKLTP